MEEKSGIVQVNSLCFVILMITCPGVYWDWRSRHSSLPWIWSRLVSSRPRVVRGGEGFKLVLVAWHLSPFSSPGFWRRGSTTASTWFEAEVLWPELHWGGVQESQLRGCFSSGFSLQNSMEISIWINQAIVCWSGLRPAHLLKMMSQLGEDYRCHYLLLWTIEQDAGKWE